MHSFCATLRSAHWANSNLLCLQMHFALKTTGACCTGMTRCCVQSCILGVFLLLQVCVWCIVDSRLLHLVLLQRHQQSVLLLAVLLQLVEAAALLHDLRGQSVAAAHPWSGM